MKFFSDKISVIKLDIIYQRKRIIMSEKSINCIHLVYFSPSGSTEKIVRKIASGIQNVEIKSHNLLPSEERKKSMFLGKMI